MGLARFGDEVVTPEATRVVGRSEAKGVLGVITRLDVAGRDRLLHQAADKSRSRRVRAEKLRNRVGDGLPGRRVGELSPEELEELLGRPRDEAFDGVGEN